MNRWYKQWEVTGYLRRTLDFESDLTPFWPGGYENVAVIFDPRGWQWHAVTERIEGAYVVTSLTITGQQGQAITQTAMRQVPLRDLTEAATGYWAEVDENRAIDIPLSDAILEAEKGKGDVSLRNETPTPEQFSKIWKGTDPKIIGDKKISRRQAVADHYNVSIYAVDKWLRKARDLGLIAPVKSKKQAPKATRDEERK